MDYFGESEMTREELAIVQKAIDEAHATMPEDGEFVGITLKDGELIAIYWHSVQDNEILVGS